MATTANIDMSEFRAFFERLESASKGEFKKELETYLDGIGNDFLKVVQDEIIRRKVMDYRRLLASFEKGAEENIWEIEEGGLTLEVGSSTNYASYVNDGHWTNTKGVEKRFVPGYWEGHRFIYDPSAKGGMVLKQHWVEGNPYFDSALRLYRKIFEASLDRKLQEWIDGYLGG